MKGKRGAKKKGAKKAGKGTAPPPEPAAAKKNTSSRSAASPLQQAKGRPGVHFWYLSSEPACCMAHNLPAVSLMPKKKLLLHHRAVCRKSRVSFLRFLC